MEQSTSENTKQTDSISRRIRSALGPYNDDEREISELVAVLVQHVTHASRYRDMIESAGQAAVRAVQSNEPQKALELLLAVTRGRPQPPQAPPKAREEPREGDADE